MAENTNPTPVNLERVTTPELKSGDIVHTHGMRVALEDRGERFDPSTGRTVVWFAGRVLNVAEVDAAGIVPVSYRTDTRKAGFGRGEFWQVQGNELAHYYREV